MQELKGTRVERFNQHKLGILNFAVNSHNWVKGLTSEISETPITTYILLQSNLKGILQK